MGEANDSGFAPQSLPELTTKAGERKKAKAKAEKPAGFGKWQDAQREQLGSTANLVLTLALASLGYASSLLFKPEKDAAPLSPTARAWILVSMAILFVSIAVGLFVNISRLIDLRWTARITRLRGVRDSYYKNRAVRLPKWMEHVKGEGIAEISKLEIELRALLDEGAKSRLAAVKAALESLKDPAMPAKLNPEVLAFATGAPVPTEPLVGSSSPAPATLPQSPSALADQKFKSLFPPVTDQQAIQSQVTREVKQRLLILQIASLLNTPIQDFRARAYAWGQRTWWVFRFQLALFAIGVLTLAIALYLQSQGF